ncbi:hypothetical protein NDU88_007918 [Pleurodeles waltl]|uniref:Uncharacterized protein n=1 Tax=Pleurodeles waltl TaxID=8319 RepID=A0AAV7PRD5_PLEWA|nr:hypothetical protein NDU88_007918 [Pleurodeles waltl]
MVAMSLDYKSYIYKQSLAMPKGLAFAPARAEGVRVRCVDPGLDEAHGRQGTDQVKQEEEGKQEQKDPHHSPGPVQPGEGELHRDALDSLYAAGL